VFSDTRHVSGVPTFFFDIPDDQREVVITIQALDSDFGEPDPYDISSDTEIFISVVFDRLGGNLIFSGDGRLDGSSQGGQGVIVVEASSQ